MFFQISPVIHKKSKPVPREKIKIEEIKTEILSLAPFTPNPKIVFEDVVIGSIQTRNLLIRNPTGRDVNLFIKNLIPDDINLVLSWTEAEIGRGSELLLEMVWGPTNEEACMHHIVISDGKRINRDIGIVFKSLNPKRIKASKPKGNQTAVKLPLSRKPISPSKKLKPQRNSPLKYASPKKKTKSHRSPSQINQQQFDYEMCKRVEYTVHKTEQVYTYQSSAWTNESLPSLSQYTFSNNKENMSPVQQFRENISSSFTSPSNITFRLQAHDMNERRETYTLDPMDTKRDAYFLQRNKMEKIVENNATFDIEHRFDQMTKSFFVKSMENSPRFDDSLDSATLPLRERNNQDPATPTLASMLSRQLQTNKLTSKQNPLSPNLSFIGNLSSSNFAPTICSSTSKPPSTNNSYEKTVMDYHSQTTLPLNESNQTYTKGDISAETYVKGNLSHETYVKGDISGGTYIKEHSSDDLNPSEASPISTRNLQVPSPIFAKPKALIFSPGLESTRTIEPRVGQNLSAIVEESSILSDSYSRIGSKRKSDSFTFHPTIKKDRKSLEPKMGWSRTGGAAVTVAKRTFGLNLTQFTATQKQTQPLSSINETVSKTIIVKNPFLYANIIDPFMTSQVYGSEDWVDQQEKNFKKWLNALLTPPDELNVKTEVDVAKVWQECTKKDVSEAPTKETLSLKYHTNKKLENLRKQAQALFRSKEMSVVLQKVCQVVEAGKLSIREDKDLHLNLKLKSDITRLILGYNPLWLRIGLETIYNEVIILKSNSDANGLVNFLLERFFKDPHLFKKYKTVYNPKYSQDLKKFILKKFLILVYFLDRAKNEKLIQHDPCLFCKNATEKESKLVLTRFARETLFAVGDISKYLKNIGYVVTYSQCYIHEFDFAVKNLGVDLRDGVRLAKVMEIIQMRNDLIDKLRVPAISRLQKVHNMQLVFNSLDENGYKIQYDIIAKDVVDGHREKTLSFLWQIIYKFEAPLMVQHATTIQTWFRSLPVVLKRRKLQRIRQRKENAARKIQAWYKRQKMSHIYFNLAEFVGHYIEERRRLVATIKIQSFFRMVIQRRHYLIKIKTIRKLQAYARGWLIRNNYKQRIDAAILIQKTFKCFLYRKRFLQLRQTVVKLQWKYRGAKQTKTMRNSYVELRKSAVAIQRRFRAKLKMRACYNEFIAMKKQTVIIQSFYKMYVARKTFLQLKSATTVIQKRFRAQKAMQTAHKDYLALKKAAIFIQRRFRANKQMKTCHNAYIALREAIIRIQSFYRMYYNRKQFKKTYAAILVLQVKYKAQTAMKKQRQRYLSLRESALLIQRRFRAHLAMKSVQVQYNQLRTATIKIQSYYRMYVVRRQFSQYCKAVKTIQQRFRAQQAMLQQRKYFITLRTNVITIQRRFKANKLMVEAHTLYTQIRHSVIKIQNQFRRYVARKNYLKLKGATLILQRRFLAQRAMKKQKQSYQQLKRATVIFQQRWRARQKCLRETANFRALKDATKKIQQRFRANKLMLRHKNAYMETKKASVTIQQWYKSIMIGRACRKHYLEVKKGVIIIEQRYLAVKMMRQAQVDYRQLRKATIVIQQYYKALILMRHSRRNYLRLKSTVINVQRRFRANKLAQKQHTSYQQLKATTVFVQRTVKANKMSKVQRTRYQLLRNSAIKIQRWYRAVVEMRKCRNYYASLKLTVATIELYYRAKKMMEQERRTYTTLKSATTTIQVRFRSFLAMKNIRQSYLNLKTATIAIQRQYRANKSCKQQRIKYQRLKTEVIFIQRTYRAKKAMERCKAEFTMFKNATIYIQQKYRAQRQMLECRDRYRELRNACLLIQRKYRAQKLMSRRSKEYCLLKRVVINLQRRFRANKLAKKARIEFVQLKECAKIIQRRLRAQLLMKEQRQQFITIRTMCVKIQRRYRANVLMKGARKKFIKFQEATIYLQRRFRALTAMRKQKMQYEILKKSVIFIQRRFRANRLAHAYRSDYLTLRHAALVLQRRFRARCMRITCVTRYSRIKWAALVIQRRYRAELAMKEEMQKYNRLRHATYVIQRRLRATVLAKTQRAWYLKFHRSLTIIQVRYRAYVAMKKQREEYLMVRMAAISLQRFGRGYLIRKHYAPLLTPEAVESRRVLKIQNAAAVKIQALWRGYSIRKSNIPVIKSLRSKDQKLVKPKVLCQSRTLAQRCEAAMLCMTTENSSLLMVINALEDLDFITRHSQELCVRLSVILPYQLYIIMTSVARSLPEMQALNIATLILINFCKFPETRKNSWHPEYMDGVINILLHWCDKDAPLFTTLCTLLWLFGHEEKWKKVLLNLPNIHQRFAKIQSLVQRKQNMVMNSKKLNNHSVFGPIWNTHLPTRIANWGLDYDRPNTFTHAVFALGNLMKILDM